MGNYLALLPSITIHYSLAIVRLTAWTYLQYMNYRVHNPKALLKSGIFTAVAVLALATAAIAADELPEAPSSSIHTVTPMIAAAATTSAPRAVTVTPEVRPVVNTTFLALAVISTGSTFADSYTTLWARQNWLSGKKGVCNEEVESAYLYGTHPTVGRAYAVASVKSVGAVAVAYYARKHHNRFWSLPLVANSVISMQGVSQNMMTCN
jgi:uncharacterized membrane protein